MKVKNINGTSSNTCRCGPWLTHWVNFSDKPVPDNCSVVFCTNEPTVGAHVQKDSASDNNWYIVPLCKAHNNQADTLDLIDTTMLVPANKSLTCEHKN